MIARPQRVRDVLSSDVPAFQLASSKRWLHFHLLRLGAIARNDSQGRRSYMEEIDTDLRPCLEAVLKMWDEKDDGGETRLAKGNGIKTEGYHAIMDELKAYASITKGQDRYPHFAKASNTALETLHSLTIHNSKSAPSLEHDDSVVFMVNHPQPMWTVHNGESYYRVPDLILGYRKHLELVYPHSKTRPIHECVSNEPLRALPWTQALMFVEPTLGPDSLSAPPSSYTIGTLFEESLWAMEKEDVKIEIWEGMFKKQDTLEDIGTSTSVKRPATDAGDIRASKRQKIDSESSIERTRTSSVVGDDTYGIVQLADFAGEALYNCFGRSHVLGLLLTGSTLNIWMFDHEGPIQFIGFDFIQDFPYYLLLLYVLQRFTPQDFGFLPHLCDFDKAPPDSDMQVVDLTDVWISNDDSKNTIEFRGQKDDGVPHKYGLNDRCTGVRTGVATITNSKNEIGTLNVALKLSWKDSFRPCEKEFIDRANELLGSHEVDPREYLPEILAERKYREFDTSTIRNAVLHDLDDIHPLGGRIPYLIVMPKYDPIYTLTKDSWVPLVNAFFALMYCHAMLWNCGIQHGDISEGNLMLDPATGKPKLCDFDLSYFTDDPRPRGFSNTGTLTFMALELLSIDGMQGCLERRYRHDVESFVAVLVWILLRYENGQLVKNAPLNDWNQTDYRVCRPVRQETYDNITKGNIVRPGWLSEELWDALLDVLIDFRTVQNQLSTLSIKASSNSKTRKLKPDETKRLEALNGIEFMGEVVGWPVFQLPPTEGSKWARLLEKFKPLEE